MSFQNPWDLQGFHEVAKFWRQKYLPTFCFVILRKYGITSVTVCQITEHYTREGVGELTHDLKDHVYASTEKLMIAEIFSS